MIQAIKELNPKLKVKVTYKRDVIDTSGDVCILKSNEGDEILWWRKGVTKPTEKEIKEKEKEIKEKKRTAQAPKDGVIMDTLHEILNGGVTPKTKVKFNKLYTTTRRD